jgi:hypothetical protein
VAYSFNAEIHYAVLDSDGTLVKAETGAGNGNNGYYPDAIQLDNGRIVMAWNSWSNTGEIIYAVLDGATYNLISGANQLYNPASQAGESNVSVTDGGNNLAVLTWSDRDFDYRRTLYYALVDSSGALVTDPMIFHQSKENVTTSFNGYGNTTYSWTPSSGVDGVVTFAGSLFGGAPGGTAGVDVRYSNHGASVATNVVMTTTLNADLSYAGDNSGVTPTVNGNNISWSFPDLLLLENREFSIYTSIPVSASIGTKYPVAAALDSDGPEANPADNADGSQVWVSLQSNLPAIIKP